MQIPERSESPKVVQLEEAAVRGMPDVLGWRKRLQATSQKLPSVHQKVAATYRLSFSNSVPLAQRRMKVSVQPTFPMSTP